MQVLLSGRCAVAGHCFACSMSVLLPCSACNAALAKAEGAGLSPCPALLPSPRLCSRRVQLVNPHSSRGFLLLTEQVVASRALILLHLSTGRMFLSHRIS